MKTPDLFQSMKIMCFKIVFKSRKNFLVFGYEMAELTLEQETALKVRELQVKFEDFETQNRLSDCVITEIDEELEEGRVSLEKLDKRVRELETDLPELIAERVATLKTENAELRHNLNLVIDAVNNITRIWNEAIADDDEQAMEDNEVLPETVGEQPTVDNEVLPLPQVVLLSKCI